MRIFITLGQQMEENEDCGCRSRILRFTTTALYGGKGKGKSVPLQAWSGPEDSRKLRFPDFMTTAQDGGKVVSLTHRPLFTPRKCSWYQFLLEAESTSGP